MEKALPCQSPDGKYEEIWKTEKPKIEESYTIVELDTDTFNAFCDELEHDRPKYITDQKVQPEQVRVAHITFIPAAVAWPYHIQFNTGERSPLFVMLKDCDKAKYAAIQILSSLGHNIAG